MAKQREKKRWRELSPREKAVIVALATVQFALTAWAQRDLSDREHEEVRGPKLMWRFVNMVNFVGPVAYLLVGRRADD